MTDPRESTERSLVDRCRKQDLEAFGKLVDAYQNRVFGFVRRMVPNPDEAADVTQEVFIRAFQNFARFDGRSSVRTWLFRIAHNLCIDRARKGHRAPVEVGLVDPTEGEEIEVSDSRWQPDQIALDEELMTVVESAIMSMSEKLRSVLLLHDREDMAYEEIADMLNLPVGTVKSRLFLARSHLQSALRKYSEEEA
ncbi:sigma-70 family RNA polymerase sigma factor [Fimbriimonas ginsengisoli]|uniref:RNA polymerase, sigma-24 subunit, ECF subfamily n=1 Tax=Fimbriimonas ginsengisoli Gsoil 348 TaxID=661478 RepID=A0A068NUB1_FIMGI|nr:sigma-70 family RNA polymerase sigma factor [Fimbriimonas ginsengisoli]AIE86952.1 RNA polymerase, sigma-24 subunit, ECF subfamily [Fimbriimonas ginsengisoli Gsoil 348]